MGEKYISNKYIHAAMASIIIGVLFAVFLTSGHIVPFGEKSWFAYDMKRQYFDFYSYYRTVFSSNNILYSPDISLGSGAMGFFTYYLSSPLLLLTLFFDKAYIPEAITLMIGVKLMLCGFFADLFFSHVIKTSDNETKGTLKQLICSVGYGFCTFVVSNSINPMWLDVFYLMPLVLWMLDRLIYKKRKTGYIVTLSVMILNNYYIAYMVCIFIVMWTLFRLFAFPCDYKEEQTETGPIRSIIRVALCSLWAVCIDAALMLPTVLELGNSPKDIFKLGLETNKGNLGLSGIMPKLFAYSYDVNQTINGTPMLYAGTVIILLTVLYFMNSRLPLREKLGMGIMLTAFYVSFALDKINLLWHAGMEPSGYPYREAFMFVVLCLICSLRELCNMHSTKLWHITVAAMAVYLMLGYVAIKKSELVYASADMLILNAAFITVSAVFLLIMRFAKGFKPEVACILLCLMQFGELGSNAILVFGQQTALVNDNANDYRNIVGNIDEAVKAVKAMDQDVMRMENMSPREQNDAMMFDYKGITHYSSSGSLYSRVLLRKMGFNDDGLYADYGCDNTATADAVLGVRYVLSKEDRLSRHPMYSDAGCCNEYYIRYNENALPIAMPVKTGSIEGKNPFEVQEKLLAAMTGTDGRVFESNLLGETDFVNEGSLQRLIVCRCETDGEVYFYLSGIEDKVQNLAVYVDDAFLCGYGNHGCMNILNMGYHMAGDMLRIRVVSDSEKADFGKTCLVTENYDKLCRCVEAAKSRMIEVEEKSSSRYVLNIPETVKETQTDGILVTFPYEDGWKVKGGNRMIKPQIIYDTMLFIPTKELQDTAVEISFMPSGFVPGLLISIPAVLLLLALKLMELLKKRNNKSISK